ncbi:MAG: S-adenosylmethionine decarboxylase [Planctomycetota bacterium]
MESMQGGVEWIVDASGLAPEAIAGEAGRARLAALFDELIAQLGLHPLAPATWHVFGGPAGVTGLVMLSESHLACHSFPESGLLTLNLYTCRRRPGPDWQTLLARHLGLCRVGVRAVERGTPSAAAREEAR